MESLSQRFAAAYVSMQGYGLAQTLSPIAPPNDPDRLRAIFLSTNHYGVKDDVGHFLVEAVTSSSRYSRKSIQKEMEGWTEVFAAYWKAVGEILAVDRDSIMNGRVSKHNE